MNSENISGLKVIEVTVKETSPGSFRVAFDGFTRGDSRGFDYDRAVMEARKYNGRTNGNWVGGEWVEVVEVFKCEL